MSVTRTTGVLLAALAAMFGAWSMVGFAADENRPAEARKPTAGATTGYKPLPAGKVRIWDTMGKDSHKHYGCEAWKRRAKWVQVPYGKLDYKFQGDPILEGHNFWVSLHSSARDANFIYAKMDTDATPSRHNEAYRSYDAPVTLSDGKYRWGERPGKLRCYGEGSARAKILKYQPGELVVESTSHPHIRPGFTKGYSVNVTTTYRIHGGKSWVEIKPVRQASEQGMHGESRFNIIPEAGDGGADFVADSLRLPARHLVKFPTTGKMLLDFIMDADIIWVMTWPDGKRAAPYASNAPGGWHAGWSRVGEGSCNRIWTAPFAKFGGEKDPIYIGILVHGFWKYQKIARTVKAGENVTVQWRRAYTRNIRGSQWRHGKPWSPTYPGKWRLTGRIGNKYYTTTVTVSKADAKKSEFTYKAPAGGELEYLIFYLYDRTDETPANVVTPMDIHRRTQAEFKGKHRTGKSKGKG